MYMLRFVLAFLAPIGAGCTQSGEDQSVVPPAASMPCSSSTTGDDSETTWHELAYDEQGRLALDRIQDGDSDEAALETHSYDEHGLDTVSRDSGADCHDLDFELYDRHHRRLPGSEDLTFDARGNVLTAGGPGLDCTYEYDAHDNVVLEDCERPIASSWTYDRRGRAIALTIEDEHWRWTWNGAGQRVREESWEDDYDEDQRHTVEWTYDGEGRLVAERRVAWWGDVIETTYSHECWLTGGPDAGALACTPLRSSEGPYLDVSLFWEGGCAIRLDGTLVCWGRNAPEPPDGRFSDVACSNDSSCALREEDGTIECFPNDAYEGEEGGWVEVPPEGPFVTIEADRDHFCALRDDGTVECWGGDREGSTRAPDGAFVAIDVAELKTCALDVEGYTTCWGRNTTGHRDVPRDVPFRQISNARIHGCGITLDGGLTCWGQPVATDVGVYTRVAVGGRRTPSTCALREDGTIACWGELAGAPEGRFLDIDLDDRGACALGEDHHLVCWGDDSGSATSPP